MNRFDESTSRVFRSLGWEVTPQRAVQIGAADPRLVASVEADGSWLVRFHATVIASGQESHPALAGCDASEIFWAYDKGRSVPEHVRRYLRVPA